MTGGERRAAHAALMVSAEQYEQLVLAGQPMSRTDCRVVIGHCGQPDA